MSIWGKIIGGTAGFALGGPIGAILGVMAGNIYDRTKKRNFRYQEIPNQQKENIFALGLEIFQTPLKHCIVSKDRCQNYSTPSGGPRKPVF